jgi:hypothetical protein
MFRVRWLLTVSLVLLVIGTPVFLHATALDATLFTTYSLFSNATSVSWVVCGSTQQSSGCYASGSLGPYGKIGALIEGNPATNLTKGTVTRSIYVLDIASGSSQNSVVLYVYKKVDTITASSDSVSVTLTKTINLSLTGGNTALASMAANGKFLFVGTNQTPYALRVQKSNFAITEIGGFSPPINVSAITGDAYGYVTVTFGSFAGGESGFVVIGPTGGGQEDGGGASFMLGTAQAVLPSALP